MVASLEVQEVGEAPAPGGHGRRSTVRRSMAMVKRLWRASVAPYTVTSFGDSDKDENPAADAEERGITRYEAWSNLVLALVGAMVCLLPSIMAQSGYLLAPPLLLLAALMIVRTGNLICETCEVVEESKNSKAGSLNSYEDLASAVGMYRVLLVTKNTVMICCLLLAQTFMVDSLAGLLPWNLSKTLLRWCVSMPIYCFMALLKDLSQLSRFAWFGLGGMALELVGLLVGCLLASITKPTAPRIRSMMPPEGSASNMVGVTLSAFIFAFAILATVPSVRAQMREPKEMPLALRDAVGFTLVLYEIIMIWGYFAFGEGVEENVIVSISHTFPKFGTIPSIGLFMNMCVTAPLFFYCVCSVVEATGSDAIRTRGTPPNTVARLLAVQVMTFVSWMIPGVLSVVGVFSSVFCVCNNVWFPILFYHRVFSDAKRPVPALGVAVNTVIVMLGVLVLIYGLLGSVDELKKEMGWHAPKQGEGNVTTSAASSAASIVLTT